MNLSITSVSKQYTPTFWGLRGFSLNLQPGILGLLGPNGAGKSTLMRILYHIALAMLFESVALLRGGFGNLVYYIVYGLLCIFDLQGQQAAWPSVSAPAPPTSSVATPPVK